MTRENKLQLVEKIFMGINIATAALAIIFGIILAVAKQVNFFCGFFVSFVYPIFFISVICWNFGDIIDGTYVEPAWKQFKEHKFSTILYWIASVVLIFFVVSAFIKGLNREISQWEKFWDITFEYGKGMILWWISSIVRSTNNEFDNKYAAKDIRAMARHFRR